MDKKKEKSNLVAVPEVAYIEWDDACADAGWELTEGTDIHGVYTLGFIVAEDKKAITIAVCFSGLESNSRIHIPKGWIKKIKRFKLDKLLGRKKLSKPKVRKPKEENSSNGLGTTSLRNLPFPRTT
jgi:hypothetical protein